MPCVREICKYRHRKECLCMNKYFNISGLNPNVMPEPSLSYGLGKKQNV